MFYGIHRFGHSSFYSTFGVTPKETGMEYADFLGATADSLAYSIVIGGFIGIILGSGAAFFDHKAGSRLRAFGTIFVGTVAIFILLGLFTQIWWSGLNPWMSLTIQAQEGKAVYYGERVGQTVQAEKADVYWLEEPCDQGHLLRDNQDLLYLGSANSISIFYDWKQKMVYRVPSSKILVVVTTRPEWSNEQEKLKVR
jgi:hypothetical protein